VGAGQHRAARLRVNPPVAPAGTREGLIRGHQSAAK
jgi:hypothetical protein